MSKENLDNLETGFIDPDPPFILPSQTERKISLGLTTRLATIADLPALAIAASDSFRFTPWHMCYHPGVPRRDHVRIQGEEMERWLLNPMAKVYLAHNGDGKLVGYIVFAKEDPASNPKVLLAPLPPVEMHPKSDTNCISNFRALREEWKTSVTRQVGPHYRGEFLGTDPRDRQNGIATKLCMILAEHALRDDLHVFIETTFYAVPFYERFAKLHHFKLKFHGEPIRLQSMTQQQLSVYLIEFLKKPPEEEGEEAEYRMRVPF